MQHETHVATRHLSLQVALVAPPLGVLMEMVPFQAMGLLTRQGSSLEFGFERVWASYFVMTPKPSPFHALITARGSPNIQKMLEFVLGDFQIAQKHVNQLSAKSFRALPDPRASQKSGSGSNVAYRIL